MPGAKFVARSRTCGAIAYVESVSLFIYCIVLAIAALNSSGATESAPIVEILIFLVFAIGIWAVARGIWNQSINARAPFFLTQVFVLIVAFTLLAGDGVVVKTVGVLVAALGVAGLAVGVAMIIAADDSGASKSEVPADGTADPSEMTEQE